MGLLHRMSPRRMLRLLSAGGGGSGGAGDPAAGARSGRPFEGLNDHYLRDIGLRREHRAGGSRVLYPWLM